MEGVGDGWETFIVTVLVSFSGSGDCPHQNTKSEGWFQSMQRKKGIPTYETRCCLLIGSDIVLASVEWMVLVLVLERDLVSLLLLCGTSSKKDISCMTWPADESTECLEVRLGEFVGDRVDFSMI